MATEENKERLFDIKDQITRAERIRTYLEERMSFDEQCEALPHFQEERKRFFDELCDNLSKLRIIDFVVSYNPYDKTIDSIWKLIGRYTLSIAQFFTENVDDVNDGLAVCSIHSPEKVLLVSADMTVEEVCQTLLELEPSWYEPGQPERICEKFGHRYIRKLRRYNPDELMEEIKREWNEEDYMPEQHEPVRVGVIVKRVLKRIGIWRKKK